MRLTPKFIIFGLLIAFISGCTVLNMGKGYRLESVEILNKSTGKTFNAKIKGNDLYKGEWHTSRHSVFNLKKTPKRIGFSKMGLKVNFRGKGEIYLRIIGVFLVPLIPLFIEEKRYFYLTLVSPPLSSSSYPPLDYHKSLQDDNRRFDIIDSYYTFDNKKVLNVCGRRYEMEPRVLKDKQGNNILDEKGKRIIQKKLEEKKGIRCNYPESSDAILHLTLKYNPTNEEFLLKMQLSKDWWWTYHPLFPPMR